MEAYEKILVPLDGSKLAEMVLAEVEKLAGRLKADVSILRVAYAKTTLGKDYIEDESKIVLEAQEYVGEIEQKLKAKGLSVDSHVTYGPDAADEILNYVACSNIDLIMMATHGRSGVQRLLLGSVAEKVLHHTTKPILLVRISS